MEHVVAQRDSWVKNAKKNVLRVNMVKIALKIVNVRTLVYAILQVENVFVQKDGRGHCKYRYCIFAFLHIKLILNYNRCEERCPDGTHGENCGSTCRCQNGGKCNPENGRCECPPGWTGPVCANRCIPGTYGENCSKLCECFNNGTCHHITGECICAPGFIGNKCLDTCPNNMYGINCTEKCHCKNGATCDIGDGSCKCATGWIGVECADRMCLPNMYGDGCKNHCECNEANTEMYVCMINLFFLLVICMEILLFYLFILT